MNYIKQQENSTVHLENALPSNPANYESESVDVANTGVFSFSLNLPPYPLTSLAL